MPTHNFSIWHVVKFQNRRKNAAHLESLYFSGNKDVGRGPNLIVFREAGKHERPPAAKSAGKWSARKNVRDKANTSLPAFSSEQTQGRVALIIGAIYESRCRHAHLSYIYPTALDFYWLSQISAMFATFNSMAYVLTDWYYVYMNRFCSRVLCSVSVLLK